MYPFRNRWRWILFGRYPHLVRAARDNPRARQDHILRQRLNSLARWNLVRFIVSIPLAFGVVAAASTAIVQLLPGQAIEDALANLLALATAITGGLSLIYLALSRLLGQLEIDILARLVLDADDTNG